MARPLDQLFFLSDKVRLLLRASTANGLLPFADLAGTDAGSDPDEHVFEAFRPCSFFERRLLSF